MRRLETVIIVRNTSVHSLFGRNHGEVLLVKGVHIDISILNFDLAAIQIRHATVGVLHVLFVVTVRIVVSGMSSSRFFSNQS